jgi:hypothetical protein
VTTPGNRAQLVTCLAILGAGVAALALPASGEGRVLVPISEGHGLSLIDAVGAGLLVIGGSWLEVLVVRRLPHLAFSPRVLFGLGLLAGLGIGTVVASVFSGFFWWWAVGAAAVAIAATVLVARMLRTR